MVVSEVANIRASESDDAILHCHRINLRSDTVMKYLVPGQRCDDGEQPGALGVVRPILFATYRTSRKRHVACDPVAIASCCVIPLSTRIVSCQSDCRIRTWIFPPSVIMPRAK